MYTNLLTVHSWFRWLVLISLLITIFNAYHGWKRQRSFSKLDDASRHWTATILHIQLTLGLWLYFNSPFVAYFYNNIGEAIKMREIRFFGMEHSLMMVVSVIIITIGSIKAKRRTYDIEKFKTITIWYAVGLFVLLTSIPWSFSPLVSRPNFRYF